LHPARLVVDLRSCPRIDAAAIVMLLQAHRRLVCVDAQLILRDPVPRVGRMLSLAHVDRVFDIERVDRDQPRSGMR
jgi:anti-anti-sigma regulatory factor